MAAAIPLATVHTRSHDEQRGLVWAGIILSTCVHFAVFALWPSMGVEDVATNPRAITTIEIPPDVIIPEAPEELARPPLPVIAETDVSDEITIPPTDWDAYSPEALAPPPADRTDTAAEGPVWMPHTVAPTLENEDAVSRALEREYPALLRDAGIGGVVTVWFYIDDEGQVLDTRLEQTSGHADLDQAALRVAAIMEFTPALNRDKAVQVWVRFPIRFRVRE